MSAFENLNQGWGGTYVAPAATTSPVGPESAPIVRATNRKYGQIVTQNPIPVSGVFTGPWTDTNQTGDTYVSASIIVNGNHNGINNGFQIQGTDDIGRGITTMLVGSGVDQFGNNAFYNLQTVVPYRYWRIVFTNEAVTLSNLLITANTYSNPTKVIVTQPTQGQLLVAATAGSSGVNGFADGGNILGTWFNGSGTVNVPVVAMGLATSSAPAGGTQTQLTAQRTPNIFKTVQVSSSGNSAAWTPTAGKKFRLMRYQIELSQTATATSGALITISFQDSASALNIAHDVWVPSAAATTAGCPYVSPWFDLGNGFLSAAANNVLNVNLSGALTAGSFRVNVCGTEE